MTTAQFPLLKAPLDQCTGFELSVIVPFGFDPDAEILLLQAAESADTAIRWELVAADCGDDAAISFLLADAMGDVTVVDAYGASEESALDAALGHCAGRVTWIPQQGQAITAEVLAAALDALAGNGVLVDEQLGLVGRTELLRTVSLRLPQFQPSRTSLMHAVAADLAATGCAVRIVPAPVDRRLAPVLVSPWEDSAASTLVHRLLATSPALQCRSTTGPAIPPGSDVIVLVSDPRDALAAFGSPGDELHDLNRRAGLERLHRSVTEQLGRRYREASRVLLVRYEDLLDDPAGQARRLGSWLDVTLESTAMPADRSAPGWRNDLTAEEAALFQERLGRELTLLGYPAVSETELAALAERDAQSAAAREAARLNEPAERIVDPDTIAEMQKVTWWHRIRLGVDGTGQPVYTPGEVWHGYDGEDYATHRFGLPTDLTGLRVADIGGWDGYFSFAAERRGAAEVTVFDVDASKGGNWGGTLGFQFAKKALDSNVRYVNAGIFDITPAEHGQFDVAFFFGVLYHLKDPLTALYRLFEMVAPGGYALIETARAKRSWVDENVCAFMYAPGLENDPTNYFYPTPVALNTALSQAGFRTVKPVFDDGERYTVYAAK